MSALLPEFDQGVSNNFPRGCSPSVFRERGVELQGFGLKGVSNARFLGAKRPNTAAKALF